MEEAIVQDEYCYCCGKKNSRGLKLTFAYPQKGRAETECTIPEYFTGWKKITHGGFLAMLLDETMAHACISDNISGVTVEMQVRYLKPVNVGEQIRVAGEVKQVRSRILEAEASIFNAGGEVVAQGSARFLKM
jgi:uncharacterized protein (TIGR00369 family)